MSEIEINLDGTQGTGAIAVDGHDLSGSVYGFELSSKVGCVPQLTLKLRVIDTTRLDAEHVQVHLDRSAAATLERAGWTPPPGTPSVLSRGDDGCPCDWLDFGHPGNPEKTRLGRTVPTCPIHGVAARAVNGQETNQP